MKIPPEVPSPVRELAVVLSQPKPMRRGSVSERTMKCGKASRPCQEDPKARHGDRKSTRLNSSHSQISYAVFCLKKKKNSYRHCLLEHVMFELLDNVFLG